MNLNDCQNENRRRKSKVFSMYGTVALRFPIPTFQDRSYSSEARLKNNVRRMRRKMVPRVKDSNPLGTQKTVSLDFDVRRVGS